MADALLSADHRAYERPDLVAVRGWEIVFSNGVILLLLYFLAVHTCFEAFRIVCSLFLTCSLSLAGGNEC